MAFQPAPNVWQGREGTGAAQVFESNLPTLYNAYVTEGIRHQTQALQDGLKKRNELKKQIANNEFEPVWENRLSYFQDKQQEITNKLLQYDAEGIDALDPYNREANRDYNKMYNDMQSELRGWVDVKKWYYTAIDAMMKDGDMQLDQAKMKDRIDEVMKMSPPFKSNRRLPTTKT